MSEGKTGFRGVVPANLMPFSRTGECDWVALRAHVQSLANISGVTAITANGHASEVSALTRDEQARALDEIVQEVGDAKPVIAGVYAESSREAASMARMAQEHGAQGLLVFPPNVLGQGGQARPEMVYQHFAYIAEATDLPIVVFEYPLRSGLHYSTQTLLHLAETIPQVVSVKEWSLDIVRFEENLRALHKAPRPLTVLSSFSQALLPSLILGADGILSGHGSIVAPLHVALLDAVQRRDLDSAIAIYDKLFALTQVVYAEPFLDCHNRMKTALHLSGQWESATVRPPLLPLSETEKDRLQRMLVDSAILESAAKRG